MYQKLGVQFSGRTLRCHRRGRQFDPSHTHHFYLFTKNFNKYIPYLPVIIAKGPYPIPFRTRKSSPSAPMVLCLKTWKSRTLPAQKFLRYCIMKVVTSLKSHKKRDLNSKLVRRRGRIYIINKKNPKYKVRQR